MTPKKRKKRKLEKTSGYITFLIDFFMDSIVYKHYSLLINNIFLGEVIEPEIEIREFQDDEEIEFKGYHLFLLICKYCNLFLFRLSSVFISIMLIKKNNFRISLDF